jgi:nucleotide-binding universal stress UspA family protein
MTDSPYQSIAVASTFSPRFMQVLAEAMRVRSRFGAELSLIYVGEKDRETAERFADVLQQLALPADSKIHYCEGDPATAILGAVDKHKVDLIVAGALEKEVVIRQFLGDVARRLVREATCSVMLFTKPGADPKPLRKIVFIADFTDHARGAFRKALRLAEAERCEKLYVIRVYTTFDEARATLQASAVDTTDQPPARTLEQEEVALEEFILSAGATGVPIEARCLRGNTGFAAMDFVLSVEADMLVVPIETESERNGDVPQQIAWVTDVIPCNLWVIR